MICWSSWLQLSRLFSYGLQTFCASVHTGVVQLRSNPGCKLRYSAVMRVAELNYELPSHLIAQRPLRERDASRLLLVDRESGAWRDRQFVELPDLLRGDELLVFN